QKESADRAMRYLAFIFTTAGIVSIGMATNLPRLFYAIGASPAAAVAAASQDQPAAQRQDCERTTPCRGDRDCRRGSARRRAVFSHSRRGKWHAYDRTRHVAVGTVWAIRVWRSNWSN